VFFFNDNVSQTTSSGVFELLHLLAMKKKNATGNSRNPLALLCFAAFAALCGCGNGVTTSADVIDIGVDITTTPSIPLVDNNLWVEVDFSNDPFWPEAQAPDNACPEEEYGVEEHPDGPWFEVYTEICAYITVEQPLLVDIPIGATVVVRIWHFSISEGDTAFHLVVGVGETPDIIWESEVPVPSGSGLLYDELVMETAYQAGAPVYFHLSNHGSNSWGFIEFSIKSD